MRNINEYEVFKRSHKLTPKIYNTTKEFPKEELYGLSSQMRRAVYSIPMNLKEGSGGTEAEFFRYVRIAYGSCDELEYQLLLSKDLEYINISKYKELFNEVVEIRKMLFGLLQRKGNRSSADS